MPSDEEKKVEILERATVTDAEPSDEEFDQLLSDRLKDYLREKLEPKKTVIRAEERLDVSALTSKALDSTEASLVASYISLRSQERQERMNRLIQLLIAIIAALQVVGTLYLISK